MAPEPAGVSDPVPNRETDCALSPDCDGASTTTSRRETGERFFGPNQEDVEWLKRCAARNVWRKRFTRTPTGSMTWGEWFAKKFGQTLEQYAEKLEQERENNE